MLYRGRTDLASESFRQLGEDSGRLTQLPGVKARKESLNALDVMSVEILDQTGARALGKPIGKYFTLDAPKQFRRGAEQFPDLVEALSELIVRCAGDFDSVLVAALGNPDITPDALGSLSAGHILVTRHLKEAGTPGFEGFSSLALSRPGVLGCSGIESAVQIKLLCSQIKPGLVIVIDALAGADLDRLCRCIQVSSSGISPGSGVGNDRQELSRETLGTPVVSIGMPTVMDAGLLAGEGMAGLFVTPRNIDSLVRAGAAAIGYGINMAVHRGLSIGDMDMLLG